MPIRRMQMISWNDRVKNEALQRMKGERNITQTRKRRKANWVGYILHRNCILRHVTAGQI
jgi:hypothetical protein